MHAGRVPLLVLRTEKRSRRTGPSFPWSPGASSFRPDGRGGHDQPTFGFCSGGKVAGGTGRDVKAKEEVRDDLINGGCAQEGDFPGRTPTGKHGPPGPAKTRNAGHVDQHPCATGVTQGISGCHRNNSIRFTDRHSTKPPNLDNAVRTQSHFALVPKGYALAYQRSRLPLAIIGPPAENSAKVFGDSCLVHRGRTVRSGNSTPGSSNRDVREAGPDKIYGFPAEILSKMRRRRRDNRHCRVAECGRTNTWAELPSLAQARGTP